jgi:hypothetical protein
VPNYNEILANLQAELDRVIGVRHKLQHQIEGLVNAIKALEILAEEAQEPIMEPPPMHPDEERGFTDHIRAIFKANPLRVFTAIDIRTTMLEWTPKADSKVMLIHIHNTLKRLAKQNELEEIDRTDGRTGYRLVNQNHLAVLAGLTGQSPPPDLGPIRPRRRG